MSFFILHHFPRCSSPVVSPLSFSPLCLPVAVLGRSPGDRVQVIKACYGLANAPSRWFESVAATMEDLGLEQLQTEPCCLRCTETDGSGEKRLVGLVVAHVDDFLFGGDQLQ